MTATAVLMLQWAQTQLIRFEYGLLQVRRRGFHTGSTPPHKPWYWEESTWIPLG